MGEEFLICTGMVSHSFPRLLYKCMQPYRQVVFSNMDICAAAGVMVVHTIV